LKLEQTQKRNKWMRWEFKITAMGKQSFIFTCFTWNILFCRTWEITVTLCSLWCLV